MNINWNVKQPFYWESSDHILVTQLSRLSSSLYPEYSRIFKLMMGHCEDYYYTKVTCATVDSLNKGAVHIKSRQGIFTVSFLGVLTFVHKVLHWILWTSYWNMKWDSMYRKWWFAPSSTLRAQPISVFSVISVRKIIIGFSSTDWKRNFVFSGKFSSFMHLCW